MTAIKEEVKEMLDRLPDDCTYEDIQYHLYVIEKVQKGLLRAEDGKALSHDNAKETMKKWLNEN